MVRFLCFDGNTNFRVTISSGLEDVGVKYVSLKWTLNNLV